jgi:lysophospholipase L1-like esterase
MYGMVTLVIFGFVELSSRVAYQQGPLFTSLVRSVSPVTVDQPYKVIDPSNPDLWRLRAGTEWTFAMLRADVEQRNAIIGEQNLARIDAQYKPSADAIAFRINAAGFKGPELKQESGDPRILVLGDSCTFGTLYDEFSYPRSLERHLRELGEQVEVVNGGVEGYSPRHVLYRLEEFVSLEPDITLLYIGWNAIYSRPPAIGAERYVRSLWLFDQVLQRLHTPRDAIELLNRTKRPDPKDPSIAAISQVDFPFLNDVETVLERVSAAGGTPVLVTLPGLFSTTERASDKALQIGHLPPFTDNPYVLSALAERYNDLLRDMAKRRGWTMIDLEAWVETQLMPRDHYFFDSVHLTEEGQRMIGELLAVRLLDVVRVARERKRARSASPRDNVSE